MIEFSKIIKTVKGLDCHYLGPRYSNGHILHRFAVFNCASEVFCYYNEQGQRVECDARTGKWAPVTTGHQIIAPPKIVEVTGWVTLHTKGDSGYYIGASMSEPLRLNNFLAKQQHTFRFEVPNE